MEGAGSARDRRGLPRNRPDADVGSERSISNPEADILWLEDPNQNVRGTKTLGPRGRIPRAVGLD
jgi:hypothetical protein